MFGMGREELLGVIRHVLTFAGGAVIMLGWADEGVVTEVVGGIMTVIGGVWSVLDKRDI